MNKFVEEFQKKSYGRFNMLKFIDAEYIRKSNSLRITFLVSTFEIKLLTEKDKDEIQSICEEIFSGVDVVIDYKKSYADEKIVKTKVVEYFNKNHQHMLSLFNDESISTNLDIEKSYIGIEIKAETPLYKMMTVTNCIEKVKIHLEKHFIENIEITLTEIEKTIEQMTVQETREKVIDDNIVIVEGARLIKAEPLDKIYSSRKNSVISMLPQYICDIKNPSENAVLCGKICDLQEKEYKNKKYVAGDDKEPEMKTLFKWRMTDTTGYMECVAFPGARTKAMLQRLADGDQVVCQGRISENNYQGKSLNFMVSTVYKAKIDYDSIKNNVSKAAPKNYNYIFPKQYVCKTLKQENFLENNIEAENEEVPSMLKNKSFVIFDTETTGLDTSTAKIVELAAVKMVNGKIVETFETLVNPNMALPQTTIQITGLTDNDLIDAPASDLIMPDFFKFTRGCSLVAHNIGYDYPILSSHSKPLGYIFENDLFDTLELSRKAFPYLKKYKLEYLSEVFELTHENAHRALSDVVATAELFKLIAKENDKKNKNL